MFALASSHVYAKARSAVGKGKGAAAPEVDANVISLSLGPLLTDTVIATGDPVFCAKCNAVLTKNAHVEDAGEGKLAWSCEFCAEANVVNIEREEIPETDSVEYILRPAPAMEVAAAGDVTTPSIVFCIDTSGSMCVSYEMDGQIKLRGSEKRAAELAKLAGGSGPQRLRSEKAAATYVTRLQLVQAAIDAQLKTLASHHGEARVGIVTFSDDVTIIGDGTAEPRTIAGDRLCDFEGLVADGAERPLEKPIRETRAALTERIFGLEETGATALGPALVTAISLAGTQPGSRVIICTDGLANVGVGSLDGDADTVAMAEAFYERVGAWAKDRGVGVSVVTIEGTECKVEHLGAVADVTGGDIERVNPLALDFSSLLANPIIATEVIANVLLHRALFFKREERVATSGASTAIREVGNATTESQITFEFGVDDVQLGEATALPFQIQIAFTKLNGMRCLRVLNQVRPITNDRAVADADVDIEVLGLNVAQQSARMAQQGLYHEAREHALMNDAYLAQAARTPEQVEMAQRFHATTVAATGSLARLEDEEGDIGGLSADAVRRHRHGRRDDSSANMMFQLKSNNAQQAKAACSVM